MDRFWRWLMHANARWVLTAAVVGLIAVLAWWAWREMRPVAPFAEAPPRTLKEAPYAGLDILAFMNRQLAGGQAAVPGNPFLSSDSPWIWQAKPLTTAATNEFEFVVAPPPPVRPPRLVAPARPALAAAVVSPPPPPPPPPPTAAVAPTTPGARTVVLTYRGMFRRPDGTHMALIEDDAGGKARYYPSGADLFGSRLGDVSVRGAALRLRDGTEGALRVGTPLTLEVPPDVP